MLSAPGRPTIGDERPPRALPAAATSSKRPRAIAESRSPWGRARDPCACAPLRSRAVTRPAGGCSPSSRTGPRTGSRSRWDLRPPLALPPPKAARWSLALTREGRWDVSRGAPCSALRTARAGRLTRLAKEGDEPDAPRAPSALPPTRAVIFPFPATALKTAGGGSLRGASSPTGAGSGSAGTAALAPALAGGCACWLSATRSTGLTGGAGGGSAAGLGRNASGSK